MRFVAIVIGSLVPMNESGPKKMREILYASTVVGGAFGAVFYIIQNIALNSDIFTTNATVCFYMLAIFFTGSIISVDLVSCLVTTIPSLLTLMYWLRNCW